MEKPLARQAGVVTGRMLLLYDLSSAAIQKGNKHQQFNLSGDVLHCDEGSQNCLVDIGAS